MSFKSSGKQSLKVARMGHEFIAYNGEICSPGGYLPQSGAFLGRSLRPGSVQREDQRYDQIEHIARIICGQWRQGLGALNHGASFFVERGRS